MNESLDFGIVFRIDDLDDNVFYIGITTDEKKWSNGYLGTGGAKWRRHRGSHPWIKYYPDNPNSHHYKRTILHRVDFRDELYEFEVREILKYSDYIQEEDRYIVSDPNCMNVKTTPQNEFTIDDLEICKECGVRGGLHLDSCSRSLGKCIECGYSIQSHRHASTCSKYIKPKSPKACEYCGATTGPHKKGCTKYRMPKPSKICDECGGKHGKHYKHCSKSKRCECCGYSIQSYKHAKNCPEFKEMPRCYECGGIGNNHRKSCSGYKGNPICEECGRPNNSHLKTCSRFSTVVCDECDGKGGHHYKACSRNRRTPCTECGSLTSHRRGCSHR